MKKTIRNIVTVVLASISLSGCITDTVRPDVVLNYSPKLVLNSILIDNESILIEVTNSVVSIDSTAVDGIDNASVTLFVNSTSVPLTPVGSNGRYTTSTTVQAGDAVTLEVSHPDYITVNAILRMPEKAAASATLLIDGGKDTAGLDSDLLTLTFQDDPSRLNFYRYNVFYYSENFGAFIPMGFSRIDPALSSFNSISLNDGSVLFTDETFNGENKTLSTVAPRGLVIGNTGDKYKFEITSITEDLYRYYASLQRAEEAKEITFNGGYNNAVVIHSNVSQGLGIIGGMSTEEVVLQ